MTSLAKRSCSARIGVSAVSPAGAYFVGPLPIAPPARPTMSDATVPPFAFPRTLPCSLPLLPFLLLCAAPLDAQVRVDKTTWQGHDALQLSNGTVELVVTTGIGPRIIRYAFVGGENVLAELADTPATKTELGEWKPWGGHRLWAAPRAARPLRARQWSGQAQVSGNRVTLTQPRDARVWRNSCPDACRQGHGRDHRAPAHERDSMDPRPVGLGAHDHERGGW